MNLHGHPKLSSFFMFDKRLGRPLGQCVNWTHVRSRARQKSKWTIGGCGALRRCGCAWTDKGTQFHCVKFRLGSAGERTICSHCYDVLNEDMKYLSFSLCFLLARIIINQCWHRWWLGVEHAMAPFITQFNDTAWSSFCCSHALSLTSNCGHWVVHSNIIMAALVVI